MAVGGFERADKKVSVHEGGYVNHPKDPGGATNKGVIQRVYDSWRTAQKLPKRSVKELEEVERLAIYKTRYWDAIKGDKLPEGIDYVVYDGAVNSGPQQSVKWLQRALGTAYTGVIDGLVGGETLRALESVSNHDALIRTIIDLREAFLKRLKTFSTFGRGWMNRINDVRTVGQAWARGDTGPEIKFIPDANEKARLEDAKSAAPAEFGSAAGATGVSSNGLALTLNQLQDRLTPYSVAGSWIEQVVVVLIIAGAIVGIGGIGYRWWAGRNNKKRAYDLNLIPEERNATDVAVPY